MGRSLTPEGLSYEEYAERRRSCNPYKVTRFERFDIHGATVLDHIPLPHRDDRQPRGPMRPRGTRDYTWRDDALNLRMRDEWGERLGQCFGWSRTGFCPCPKSAARNADDGELEFCIYHLQGGRVGSTADDQGSPMIRGPGRGHTAAAIVSRAEGQTRHGLYSHILRQRLEETLSLLQEKPELARDVQFQIAAMEAANTDNPAEGLEDAVRMLMAHVALLHVKYAEGKLQLREYTEGLTMTLDQLRKTATAKFGIIGSSSDELDRAIDVALDELEGTDGPGVDVSGRGPEHEWAEGDGADAGELHPAAYRLQDGA
jgi:hypothetical protein